MAISQLNANEIINIASNYQMKFNLKKEEEDEIKKILIEKGYKKFYIYRYIAKVKNFLIKAEKLKFTIEIPINKERLYMEELNKACYIKILKRKTEKNNIYSNEVYATIIVYY